MTAINAHLMDCRSKAGREALTSAFLDALLAEFGSAEAVADAKRAHDEVWAERGEYPCGDEHDDEIMGQWDEAVSRAMRVALKAEGWLGIDGSAYMDVTVTSK
jgi:hypothetical protein